MKYTFLASAILGCALAGDTAAWKQRSVYQVLTDRYARTDGSTTACTTLKNYCGGTFKGMQNNISYIAGMGFDAIWISPVVDNIPDGYHGYWARNWNEINAYFGSSDDLKELVDAAHALGIWVMVDVVGNHVAPIGTDYSQITPYNQSSHYHTDCQIIDWNNQYQVENCRLYDLPDLDQSNSFVRSELKSWVANLIQTYGFDGIRIDTIPEVPKDFWAEFGPASGVFQMGECFNVDPAYVGQYQGSVTALFNYPMYFTINEVFGNGSDMGNIKSQDDAEASLFTDIDALGVFVDNHDNPRFLYNHPDGDAQLRNAIVFSLTTRGIPFVYYGSEQYYRGGNDPNNRESLWQDMDSTSDLYKIIAKVNAQRKKSAIWNEQQVERYAAQNFYAFSRGSFLVTVTNGSGSQSYKVKDHPFTEGETVCNIFVPKTDCQVVSDGVSVQLLNGESKIYVPQAMLASEVLGSEELLISQ